MPLLDTLMSMVTPQVTETIAAKLGEPPEAIQKGLQTAISAVLGAIGKQTATPGFLEKLSALINNHANDTSLVSHPTGLTASDLPVPLQKLSTQFLDTIFGSSQKQAEVSHAIEGSAGLKAASASSLLTSAAAFVMAWLGKQGTTPASLAGMLAPADDHHGHAPVESAGVGNGAWVLPAFIGLLLLGGLFWYLLKGPETVAKKAEPEMAAAKEPAPSLWAALGELAKRKLPDGTELELPRLGVENRLIDFIEDPAKLVDKETWFDFDRLLFDTGKATLRPESQDQLKDVAAILKAYPKVHMRIGGYTDNVGDKAANVTLSQERAANVDAELTKLGVEGTRLDSKGYGEEHPVASNDTEEGRSKNRRISMRVTAK